MTDKCADIAQLSIRNCAKNAHDFIGPALQSRFMQTEWFKSRKRDLKITDADIASALGVERSVANRVINGKVDMKVRRATQMAELFKCTRDEILFRAGLSETNPAEQYVRQRELLSSTNITIWGKVAAGVWLEESFIEPDPSDRPVIVFDRFAGDSSTEELFAVESVGDSMNLAFLPDTILICQRVPFGIRDVEEGRYIIVAREQHGLHEMTCKKLRIDKNGDFLLCSQSDNPKYSEPIRIPRSEDSTYSDGEISVIGVVVRDIRDHSRAAGN